MWMFGKKTHHVKVIHIGGIHKKYIQFLKKPNETNNQKKL